MAKLIGITNEEKIWNYLISAGYTNAGVAGIMGNLFAESGLLTNNLQNTFSDKLGSDTYYTASVNDKSYSKDRFINDRAGYGLAQWTYYSRKRGLYEMTVEKGLSIADLKGQLDFLIKELNCFNSLNALLKSTNDLNEASDRFLKDFENPAVKNYTERREFGQKYYDKYADAVINIEKDEENVSSEVKGNIETEIDNIDEFKTYKVVSGDSWWKLAIEFLGSGSRMKELAEFNDTTIDHMLHPGDVIKLPILKDELIKEDSNTHVNNKSKYVTYDVKIKDSWYSIAKSKMGDASKMNELAKFNGKTTKSILHPGDKIKIPIIMISSAIPATRYTTYTVKINDSWWGIASEQMGSPSKMEELAKFNGKTTKTIIHPGEVLKIPK